ncbi:MAG: fasciclin domain-containing protein [Prevotella sp.]|nr:fasciclin domain-containing protein [Prevotella sp.]
MKQKQISKQRHQLAIAALGLLVGTSVLQGCKDDNVLTGQPDWLGNSIYERLEEDGQYKTMLRLIDDLGQHEVLSHTGSKTLFAANDSAFQAWFAKNSWGVSSYDRLSLSQKKLLLNNSMVNNAYLIELLSNGRPQGEDNHPEEGRTMRRETATSIYDSVQIMKPSQMPNTPVWAKFKDNGRSIPILKDATPSPMIHFLPAFMKINKMTNNDLDVLTNHQANDVNEAWVNGKKVVERDITCKNGYIQKVNGVFEASPNMAEIVHMHPKMSKWAELMDRFSAPYYSAEGTREYNRLYNNEDSVYVLRYYADLRYDGRHEDNDHKLYNTSPDGEKVTDLLKFDPGWNQYIDDSGDANMNYDAGALIVPTNEAIEKWWNEEGRDFQVEYGEIDNLPIEIIKNLLRVNMLSVLTEAIPSKFDQVLNDAKVEMGITMADVDSVFMGCNGVVYMTNRVFTPALFQSVAGPASAHPTVMKVIYEAIDKLNFLPFLLSMDAKYSLILPSDDAMLWYIDPYSYGNEKDGMEAPQVLRFSYDYTRKSIMAYRYDCIVDENGEITIDESVTRKDVSSDISNDCLKRLLEQLIIVGDIEDGHEYYKSKGGTPIRVFRSPDGRIAFAGGWQIDHNNKPLPVNPEDIYEKENGKSYVINGQMPLTTDQSVYLTLENMKDSESGDSLLFMELLDHDAADLMAVTVTSKNHEAGMLKKKSRNLKLLDNYNYTIYAPTNKSIQELIDKGLLPTWEDYEAQTDSIWGTEEAAEQAKTIIKDIIVGFLRYHIQDHAIMIGMAPENGKYENSFETSRRNLETGRFYPVTVNNEGDQMWVKDVLGNKRNVVKTEGLYNRICRDYWFRTNPAGQCYMASDAVVHQIDGVLLAEEMKPWKEILNKNVRRK